MNRERRKELGKVFFDLAKYLLTIGVIGPFFLNSFDIVYFIFGIMISIVILIIAFYITPKDKN